MRVAATQHRAETMDKRCRKCGAKGFYRNYCGWVCYEHWLDMYVRTRG
ncbi:hypothetical protein PBI_GAIA_37 [Mycobacterium phage Gaia]|uniref:Uncharacterized protein n=1 Tax=Mycobacterium phage Gaia TaxID=1486472 RepID=A0A068F1N5_9CAUD|nr:hypothetical protein VC46_gp037 [Mycobacterium phage Gaia]AID58857.1 hypothetical protein PBI_GAIA_37 [Mycobacterium phage Gaia]AYQ99979.1 hypothetical protein PBI_NEBKISS_38 [Mycobacterium phage Nebkiss]